MLKLRGLGLMALLVFSGVTVGALPAFAPTTANLTVRNHSNSSTNFAIYQKPPGVVQQAKATPPKKPAKHP